MPTSKDIKDLDLQVKKTLISSQSFKKQSSFDTSKSILGIHRNVSSLAGSVRKVVIRVGALEKVVNNNSKKITSLKKISVLQGPQIRGTNIGAKLPGNQSENLDKNISVITDLVSSIADTLKEKYKTEQKTSEYNRRKGEQEKRGLAESKLEKRFDGIKKLAQKIISPVKSLLDKILEFIGTVILGRIVYKIVEWFGDPKNADKVKSVIRFVKDWWPALLASYILFGNSFSGLIRGTLGMVARFTIQLGRVAIPSLLRFISANPVVAGVAAVAGMGVLANEVTGQRKAASIQAENKAKAQTGRGLGVQGVGGVGSMGPTTPYGLLQGAFGGGLLNVRKFSGGGFAEGYVSGEKGVDKVPAMLSDGEFVMSRGAVEKYGVDTLEAMNAAGGGTNKPKIMGGKTYAAGGGYIGDRVEYYLNEILKGLAPQYKWANDLARKAGATVQNRIQQTASGLYNSTINQGVNAQRYLSGGGLEKDVSKLMQSGTQFGAGLYDQALKIGNQALSEVQSGRLQRRAMDTASQISQVPKKAGSGFFDFMSKMSSTNRYQEGAARMEKVQNDSISLSDKFVKMLPDGPFKDIADKGLIPIPSGDATMMRNLTFAKALLGPLGRPFKILSNKEVDKMRQETIKRTMNKSGLIVDPKTGQVRMNWNQEDINKGARGGGAYTDDLGVRGGSFNSILGRFTASTEGKGNTLYSDDRYNFNKTVAEYASLAKKGLLKGSMSDATYYGASMLGRFAQDIGWLNQRALGSRIKIGEIDRNRIDPKTGKPMKPAAKPSGPVTMYGPNDPRRKQSGPYQSRFARPRNAGVRPVGPPVARKPKVVYGPPVPSARSARSNKPGATRVPKFTPYTKGTRTRVQTLGLMR